MKKILFILTALTMLIAVSCKKEEKKIDYKAKLTGEWHYVPEDFEADIYAVFEADGGFELYQKIGGGRHKHYSGTWSSEESTLSGTYSDGSAWGSTYRMEFSDDNTMVLTALNGSEDVRTYVREDVPADVKDSCTEAKSTDIIECMPAF